MIIIRISKNMNDDNITNRYLHNISSDKNSRNKNNNWNVDRNKNDNRAKDKNIIKNRNKQ